MLRRRALALRWVHLLLGGALLMPPYLLSEVVVAVLAPGGDPRSPGRQLAAFLLALPMAAAVGLFAPVRALSTGAARALAVVPARRLAGGPATSWAARRRTAAWFVLHTGIGALLSGATLSVPPAAVVLLVRAFSGGGPDRWGPGFLDRAPAWSAAPLAAGLLAVALLAALVLAAAGAGALLGRVAPRLLGPTPADRLAAAEARAAELARRNRLARDLHDSIGHSLSAVTLQAGAARRVLDRDVEFARRALTAIEHTAGTAVAELDRVLGMLREDDEPAASARPTLADLGELLEQTRAAGADLRCTTSEHLGELDPAVSEHAYRVVQEGLSNVLRHAGAGPVRLDVTTSGTAAGGDARLHVRMRSPLRPDAQPGAVGGGPSAADSRSPRAAQAGAPRAVLGGRGLPGVAERATLLGGDARWGPDGDSWLLDVRLPLRGTP